MQGLPHEIRLLIAEECNMEGAQALRRTAKLFAKCETMRRVVGMKIKEKKWRWFYGVGEEILRHYHDFVDVKILFEDLYPEDLVMKVLKVMSEFYSWGMMSKYFDASSTYAACLLRAYADVMTKEEWEHVATKTTFFLYRSITPWADYVDWDLVSGNHPFDPEEMAENKDRINWKIYSRSRHLSPWNIANWGKYLDWDYLSGQEIILRTDPAYYGWVKRDKIPPAYRAEFDERLRNYRWRVAQSYGLGAIAGIAVNILFSLGYWLWSRFFVKN